MRSSLLSIGASLRAQRQTRPAKRMRQGDLSRAKSSLRSPLSRPIESPSAAVPGRSKGCTGTNACNATTTTTSHHRFDSSNHRRRGQHQLVVSSRVSLSPLSVFPGCLPSHHGRNANTNTNTNPSGDAGLEEGRRLVAMRLFLESLQLATAHSTLSGPGATNAKTNTNTNTRTTPKPAEVPAEVPGVWGTPANRRRVGVVGRSILARSAVPEAGSDRGEEGGRIGEAFGPPTAAEEAHTTGRSSPSEPAHAHALAKDQDKPPTDLDRLKSDLGRAIHRRDPRKGMSLFRESQRNRWILPRKTVTDLFFMVSESDPASGYTVIQYYNQHYLHQDAARTDGGGRGAGLDGKTNKRLSLYKRICNSIGLLEPHRHNAGQMQTMVENLLGEMEAMETSSKEVLYPKLVLSLLTQRIATVGRHAFGLYETIVREGFETKAGWLNRLLSTSRFHRQGDVPYHDVIRRLVDTPGGQLNADAVLPAIQNMFPYTEEEPICVALESWLDDAGNKEEARSRGGGRHHHHHHDREHRIDRSMLEAISTGAAQSGSTRQILLVWEVLEACGHAPTELLYENTVMAFANDSVGNGLEQAFAALASMKEDGFRPSRPLIRSFSSAIRLNRSLIGRARRMLTEDKHNEMASIDHQRMLSLESLNVVLSSYAERADPEDAVEILGVMGDHGIEPDADSYSFVIEALGRDIKKRLKLEDASYKQRNLQIADTILSMMEENGVPPTTHVIRNYVELLCLSGEIETATSIVEDGLESADKGSPGSINNITIYRVAKEHAALGNFDKARELAETMTEHVPALHRGIRSREQRSSYVREHVRVEPLPPPQH
ncbi:unnamed protein product [Pseudo-nitzschia multistriata]|uniref:Pentacotripeptide-repeat region of PRORP domain-containing protein n=1 Tax=Pseudo-nitzschia multistriata TaxID=183589 RepID=A0A448ZNH2_9STRA|nr:unnamed protein product [Pseudo-nitzschia multistriata]